MGSTHVHSNGSIAGSRSVTKRRPRKPLQKAEQVLPLSIRDAIETQRRQLFRASAVVDMCRLACSTKYAEEFDQEQAEQSLWVVRELIDGAAEALEKIAATEPVISP
jgi:hypothetical protein